LLLKLELIIRDGRLRWSGHILLMDDGRLPKQAVYLGHRTLLSARKKTILLPKVGPITVVLNLGSRDPLGVPNANLGGPKRKSGLSTNFPQYK